MEEVCNNLLIVVFKPKQIVFSIGDLADAFYLVIEGNAVVFV